MKSNLKKDTLLGKDEQEVFEYPKSEITPNNHMGIERIILHTNYTQVDFVYISYKNYTNGGWIQLHQDCFIRPSGTEVEYKMIEAISIPIAPSKLFFNAPGKLHHYSLLFPALPKDIKYIDVIEKKEKGDFFNFYSVALQHNEPMEIRTIQENKMEAGKTNILKVNENHQLHENANLNSKFKLGQVVRFRNYKRNVAEHEAYFLVIQEADSENELELYALNTNRLFPSGSTVFPEFPEEDLILVNLKPVDVLEEEVFMYKKHDESLLTGVIVNCIGEEEFLTFSLEDSFLVSNMKVEYHTSEDRLMRGKIYVSLYC